MKQKSGQDLRHALVKNGHGSHFSLISLNVNEPKTIGLELRHALFENGQQSYCSLISLNVNEPKQTLSRSFAMPHSKMAKKVTLVSSD